MSSSSWLMYWDCPRCKCKNVVTLSSRVNLRTGRVTYQCFECQQVYGYRNVKRYKVSNWHQI